MLEFDNKFLRVMRKDRGFTLQQLADMVGSGKSYIWGLEKGDSKNPSFLLVSVAINLWILISGGFFK